MRRLDVALIAVVGALGIFVATEFLRRQPALERPSAPPRASAAAAAVVPSAGAVLAATGIEGTDSTDMAVSTTTSSATAPTRDLKQILAHIAETPGTYMTDMITDLGGRLVRWPDRRQDGLRVWVQTATMVPD